MLTKERAKEICADMVTEHSLILHLLNVSYAMGGMAKHFGEDVEHWEAVGYLHDYDYQKFPEEHLQHTEQPLDRLLVLHYAVYLCQQDEKGVGHNVLGNIAAADNGQNSLHHHPVILCI